jgi:formylglycine-generating enzyme required for sulfatase activity
MTRLRLRSLKFWLSLNAALLLFVPAASAVNIDWVTVGGAGNTCDTQSQGCFGAVAQEYRIAKTEVSNAQYTEFLNAVAATDTHSLYNGNMGTTGGITQSGSSGSLTYSTIPGRENLPVNYVSFYDSLRFANWLQNGQPTGAQGNATTEDGAYTITSAGITANSITRNAGATIFLTSEDEWYKAAYYDALSASFFDYPANTDVQTTCAAPGAVGNIANCAGVMGSPIPVGLYALSASPNGTLDQGGNVQEWNESVLNLTLRGTRGGSFASAVATLGAQKRNGLDPSGGGERINTGFRVAAVVPEPGTGLLVMTGLIGLACKKRRA